MLKIFFFEHSSIDISSLFRVIKFFGKLIMYKSNFSALFYSLLTILSERSSNTKIYAPISRIVKSW